VRQTRRPSSVERVMRGLDCVNENDVYSEHEGKTAIEA
jgi:hypothetical protein